MGLGLLGCRDGETMAPFRWAVTVASTTAHEHGSSRSTKREAVPNSPPVTAATSELVS